MWSRKELKAEAKANLKKNYWAMVAVCFLMAILIAEYSLSTETINYYDSDNRYSGAVQNEMNSTGGLGEEMDHLLPGSEEQLQQELHPTKGVFSICWVNPRQRRTISFVQLILLRQTMADLR